MTSTLPKYERTATPIKEFTSSSGRISEMQTVNPTSNPVGASTTHLEVQHSTPPCYSSQPPLKEPFGAASSDISTTNNASTSLPSADDYFDPNFTFTETDTHVMVLDAIHQGNKWHQDLVVVHGFAEAESCECFSRAGKYLNSKEFPEDAVIPKLLPHAKEGWVLLKEVDRLCKAYPKELSDLGRRAFAEGKPMGTF
jgi:hypothetical protein